MNRPLPSVERTVSRNRQTPYCSQFGASVPPRAANHFAPGAPAPTKRATAKQMKAGTVALAAMSDQPLGPLGAAPRTCRRIDVASPQVAEWKNIWEKLISAKVRAAPRKDMTAPINREAPPSADFVFPAA